MPGVPSEGAEPPTDVSAAPAATAKALDAKRRATDTISVRAARLITGDRLEATRSGAPAGAKRAGLASRHVAGTDERQRRSDGDDTPLVLDELGDKLDAFWSLATADDADADKALEEFGARGRVEADMAYQLSVPAPLAHPERFEQAHRLVMRGLEVLDRNGGRKPSSLPKLGPLKPAASWFVQLVTRYIVRSYQVSVAENLARLYARREANCRWGSDEMHMLRRARFQAERLAPGYKRKALGLPTFLVGGAVISGAVGALQAFGDILARQELILVLTTLLLFGLFILTSFGILYAAGISRRRIRVCIAQPLAALYETIGACGTPPKDQARTFAVYAIVLTGIAWLVIPLAIIFAIVT